MGEAFINVVNHTIDFFVIADCYITVVASSSKPDLDDHNCNYLAEVLDYRILLSTEEAINSCLVVIVNNGEVIRDMEVVGNDHMNSLEEVEGLLYIDCTAHDYYRVVVALNFSNGSDYCTIDFIDFIEVDHDLDDRSPGLLSNRNTLDDSLFYSVYLF